MKVCQIDNFHLDRQKRSRDSPHLYCEEMDQWQMRLKFFDCEEAPKSYARLASNNIPSLLSCHEYVL